MRTSAQWCTLCYADLRTAPEPPSAVVSEPAAGVPGREVLDPLTAPLALLERVAEQPADAVAGAASADEPPEPAWPCSRCSALVPIEEATCTACGAPFMPTDSATARLQEIKVSTGAKIAIMVGGSVVVAIVVFAVLFILAALR